jgi:penicillin-binding protein 1A
MRFLGRTLALSLLLLLGLGVAGILAVGGAYLYLAPHLPPVDTLRDVQLQVPLRVYSREGLLMAEFGEHRRIPVRYEQLPERLIQAFLAAEDDRFFAHPGIDYQGILRAGWAYLLTGEKRQGGSTITMQVARNFFLTREKTFIRKLNEILLALNIETELSKEEIMELYLNKIFLGHRAYGVGAAAQVYYGKDLGELTLPQVAMLAGLPKAPSKTNPVSDPQAARSRRDYVLRRMHELEFVADEAYRAAVASADDATLHAARIELSAPYVAEMVRAEMVERYGADAYVSGLDVYTRIEERLQRAAQGALHQALLEYDRRHGYRGPEAQVPLGEEGGVAEWQAALADVPVLGGLLPGLVTAVGKTTAQVFVAEDRVIELDWEAMAWARPYIDEYRRGRRPKGAADVVAVGDIVRLEPLGEGGWRLAEIPQAQGALVSLDPDDGGIRALVGGMDFAMSKFNRVTQAHRQPGSSFKPFIYTAALAKGYTPATIINDAPVVFRDAGLESEWRPQNYSGKFFGPTRLREALYRSRNLVSIRLLDKIGVDYAVDYLTRFGFAREDLPRNLTLALGTASVTPLDLAAGFAVLANGGFRVEPWIVERAVATSGASVYEHAPARACQDCTSPEDGRAAPQVIDPRDGYLMYTMMQDVIRRGTGRRARALDRSDLAGKTGTTNDQMDAWFSGFNHRIVATAWVGFDQLKPLGARETGAKAALPMWVAFMEQALEGEPDAPVPEPPGLIHLQIDPATGLPVAAQSETGIPEVFRADATPGRAAVIGDGGAALGGGAATVDTLETPLF